MTDIYDDESPQFQATLDRCFTALDRNSVLNRPKRPYHVALRDHKARQQARADLDHRTEPFRVGARYRTREGRTVRIVEELCGHGNRIVLGHDGIWRHDKHGRGWISCASMVNPYCLIPGEVEGD